MAAASGTMIVVQNLLLLALISCAFAEGSRGRSLLAAPSETVFDVTKYGAEADGETDNYEQFIKAWVAACHSKTPARLLIPKGEFVVGAVVFQGPCSNSPIVVEVQGNVKAQSDFTEYPNAEWFAFEDIDGLHVMGHGSFNGQGKEVWQYNDCHKNKKCQMFPTSLKFTQVNNALVEDIHTIDSMGFHVSAVKCNTFTFRNVTVTAPQTSPNTDGIHLSRCNDVTITDCVIGTGDDCISMVRGVNNVNISKITCGPGHGISVGSLGKYDDEEDVKNVFIKSCSLTGTTNGIRIKTWPEGLPTKVVTLRAEDIVMNNVENPIIIDQGYCPSHSCKNKKVFGANNVSKLLLRIPPHKHLDVMHGTISYIPTNSGSNPVQIMQSQVHHKIVLLH
ncbi:hypothetical protein Sjap_006882 [Stephania japonica]|uniref:Uncharacterized protein n=1 Tax=Stephania japonica TaxID=461633 RepID=A0AAP0PLH7_9MAGN